MAHYAITMADGSVAVMTTVGRSTPEECIAKWHPDDRAKVASHRMVSANAIPNDRTFRNAWKMVGDRIEHDMEKAREILRDRLRAERAPLLAALDVEFLQAIENPDVERAASDIAADKQTLRDVTEAPAIDLAATVDELKSLTLVALTKGTRLEPSDITERLAV